MRVYSQREELALHAAKHLAGHVLEHRDATVGERNMRFD